MHCAVSWEYVPGPTRRGVEGDDICVKSAVSGKRFSVGHVEGLVGGLAAELIAGRVEGIDAECGPGRRAEDPCNAVAPQGALFAECDAVMERPARGCGCGRERGCGAGTAVTVHCMLAIDEAPMSTTAVAVARSIGDVTAHTKTGELGAVASTEAFAARVVPASVLACVASVSQARAELDAAPAGFAPGIAAVLCLGVTASEAVAEAEAQSVAHAEVEAEVEAEAGGSSAEARARCRSSLLCGSALGKEAGAALPWRGRTL